MTKEKKEKIQRPNFCSLGCTALKKQNLFFLFFFFFFSDKFHTEIGTNINYCCHHHDERRWYFDDFDEDEL